MRARDIFLTDVPLARARLRFADTLGERTILAAEEVALADALDRVSAEPAFARLSSPHYHACAMDGYAVASAATAGARENSPLPLEIGVDAFAVNTGDPLPRGCDAVIMIEQVAVRDDRVEIRAPVAPYTHVRPLGEDVVATEAIVPARRVLQPADLAALAAGGVTRVRVVRRPRVTIVTTGDELVAPAIAAPPPGTIVDSNAVLLAASVRAWGGIAHTVERVPDDPGRLNAIVREAIASADIVVVNAGSSAGTRDFTAEIFADLGEVVVHGVAIRPGHPVILARAGTTPLLGIPGYPVSAAICADLFLRPLVQELGGRPVTKARVLPVRAARKIYSPLGELEFVRAVAGRVDGELVATPLRRGAATITSLARANCLLPIPPESEGVHAGTMIDAIPLRDLASIERTLLAVGSHDVALDILAGALAAHGVDLASSNVGSIAGIVAVASGEAHLAGTHVLDPASRTYNLAAVRRYAPSVRLALVHFARRSQGLIVAKGNPLGLRTVADLARTRARFVNRQRDAGTRMLFDALLADAHLTPVDIIGYEHLEFTHLAVAALIADGSADAGLGIHAAAAALGCDFVPLADEPYELALRASTLDSPSIRTLLQTLAEPAVRERIDALPGYDARDAGAIRFVDPQ